MVEGNIAINIIIFGQGIGEKKDILKIILKNIISRGYDEKENGTVTKLTPELQAKFIHLLEIGVPIKYACEALNIDESTYFIWMKQGRKKTEGKYFEFFKLVESAPAKAMARKLQHLETAAQRGSVAADTWFLEHKYPEEFKTQPTEVNLTLKPTVQQLNDFYELKDKEKKKQLPEPKKDA